MLKVVESFSGIGSQAKALKNINIDHEIIATIDWDINAIIAYDFIHNGKQILDEYDKKSEEELLDELMKYTLSSDGKSELSEVGYRRLSREVKIRLLAAINRCNNLGSITDVKGKELPEEIDLFTYSFPCQDLSIAGAWHGNNSGIDREANNRSGMLWQVERILFERNKANLKLPRFLLMENVSNILSNTHKHNFEEWKNNLKDLGYINFVYKLNAVDFGIPQKRERVYMLSVLVGNDIKLKDSINEYVNNMDIYLIDSVSRKINKENNIVKDILRLDYTNAIYKEEADKCQPNYTKSRQKIHEENDIIYDGENICTQIISTITTKQDRNPNSGVILYNKQDELKSPFRYLTPRECFLLMGFKEEDFQALKNNDFKYNKSKNFFVDSKLYKLAGNSIVVNVLENIFKQIDYINNEFF